MNSLTALLTLCSLVLFLRVEANENVMNEVSVVAAPTLTLAAETPLPVKDKVKLQDICSSHYSCYNCAGNLGCGWCRSNGSCMVGSASGAFGYCAYGWTYDYYSCSDSCRQYPSCMECYASGGLFCGWCSSSRTCMPGTSIGPSSISDTCDSGNWNFRTGCSDCRYLSSCDSCTSSGSCYWCYSEGKCITYQSSALYCTDIRYLTSDCPKSNAELIAAIVVPIVIVVIIIIIVIVVIRRRRTYIKLSQPAVMVTTQPYQPPPITQPTNQDHL